MPGTKGDPKSSETIGIEKKIIAENVNVSVNVNQTIEIFLRFMEPGKKPEP